MVCDVTEWYSRLDFDVLTTLHNLRKPCLLVSQPCPGRMTETVAVADSITIEGGWRSSSLEEVKGADSEDGCEGH